MQTATKAQKRVNEQIPAFESRWTLRALLTHDPELYARFREQQVLWVEALVGDDGHELENQTDAMIRGWQAVTKAMEIADVADDAYLIGKDDEHGITVAISEQEPARERVRELYGEHVIFLRPGEVATLLARQDALLGLKQMFAGSELLSSPPPG